MSVHYQLLGETQAAHLRKQRLLDLEADHFRCVLDVEELPDGTDPTSFMEKIADIERRIKLHREALGLPGVVTAPKEGERATPDGPDVG